MDHALNHRLKADVDQLVVERQKGERPILMTYPELGPFTSEPRVVNRVADLMGGQKTGIFYDQRPNHAFAARFAPGARVLDVFSHVGGFSLAALAGGAESAVAVEE